MADLQDRGFIVAMQKGAFSWKTGAATEWRLTEFTCDVPNQLASKELMRWQPKTQKPVPVSELNGTCSRTARYPTPNRPKEPSPKRYPTPNREQGFELSHGSDSDTHVVYQGDSGAREPTAVFGGATNLQALRAELEDDGYDLSRLSAELVIGAEMRVAEHGARAAADWLKEVLAEEAPR